MATYKLIAELSGVSIGTVYRVLRNTGRVAEATSQRVRDVATQLDYTPNVHASNLKRSRTHVFGLLSPRAAEDNGYWAASIAGVTEAVAELRHYRIELRHLAYAERSSRSFEAQWRRALGAGLDGLIIAATTVVDPAPFLTALPGRLHRAYIDTELPDERRVAFIGQDSLQSGAVAGRLLSLIVGGSGHVVTVRTLPGTSHIDNRIEGLRRFVDASTRLTHEVVDLDVTAGPVDVMPLARTLRRRRGARPALFVTNSAASLVLAELGRRGIAGVPTVGYDLVPGNVRALRDGTITFLLNQRPYDQGYRSFSCPG